MKKIIKLIVGLFILIVSISLVSALTINELIDSTNFDYYTGDINVTGFSDSMSDKNGDGKNDTLTITLDVYVNQSGTYDFIVDLEETYGVLTNNSNKSFSTGSDTIDINFDTRLFNQDKHNYSVRIYDANYTLVYRKDDQETDTYTDYEKGINITSITDENVNNDIIRINLTLNVTDSQTVNITAFLKYNDSYISSSKQETLNQGIQTVSIDFDNETIKSTHYNNNFTLDLVAVGNKIFDTNYSTAIYNYEDFAKTSYIKNFTSGTVDTNSNNLSEFLEINTTLNIKSDDSYELKGELYDLFDNHVVNFSKTESLTTGINKVQIRINGTDIYTSNIDGPYLINYIKLLNSSGDTVDYLYQPYTTNISYYTDYERPPLPDLYIDMDVGFDDLTNITNITLNVSNIGQAPAFNVFTDLFDNSTYSDNRTKSYLNISESLIYNFTISDTSSDTIYTAIVDLGNYVDESNESNNIVDNAPPPPTILLISPTNNSINTATNKPSFVFNVSTDSSCDLLIDGVNKGTNSSANANTSTTIIPTSVLTDGSYTWKINCISSGISGTSERQSLKKIKKKFEWST